MEMKKIQLKKMIKECIREALGDDQGWKKINSYEEMTDFADGVKWNIAKDKKMYKTYEDKGCKFFGRDNGEEKQLKCVYPDGKTEVLNDKMEAVNEHLKRR